MTNQYTGECIVGLMNTAAKSLRLQPDGQLVEIPSAQGLKLGGIVVTVDSLEIHVGPETIESLRRIDARKRQANANGEPFTMGYPPSIIMKAVLKEIGLPDLFD